MNIINSVFNLIPILILVFLASVFLSFVIQFIYISIHEHKKIKKSDTPSTYESKDFPPEMIQEICQQRKQHKIIMGTSQRFQRMAKPLREQINFLYEPITFAGCLTFVRKRKPSVDDDGKIDRLKTRKLGTYFFVHDEELRSSYDTWQKILRQANGGYTASPFKQEPAHQNIAIEVSDRRRKL